MFFRVVEDVGANPSRGGEAKGWMWWCHVANVEESQGGWYTYDTMLEIRAQESLDNVSQGNGAM